MNNKSNVSYTILLRLQFINLNKVSENTLCRLWMFIDVNSPIAQHHIESQSMAEAK